LPTDDPSRAAVVQTLEVLQPSAPTVPHPSSGTPTSLTAPAPLAAPPPNNDPATNSGGLATNTVPDLHHPDLQPLHHLQHLQQQQAIVAAIIEYDVENENPHKVVLYETLIQTFDELCARATAEHALKLDRWCDLVAEFDTAFALVTHSKRTPSSCSTGVAVVQMGSGGQGSGGGGGGGEVNNTVAAPTPCLDTGEGDGSVAMRHTEGSRGKRHQACANHRFSYRVGLSRKESWATTAFSKASEML
jgi:hypothetical protein